MQDLDEVLDDQLQTTIDVDFSVLSGLDILDESIDVGLNDLDLLPGQSEERSQNGQQSVEGRLQFRKQSVKLCWRFIGWRNGVIW